MKAYLDDILIHSMTCKEHLDHIQQVLSKQEKVGSTIKKKMNFTVNKCKYLGHVVKEEKFSQWNVRSNQCNCLIN